jgi:hypothetical protein
MQFDTKIAVVIRTDLEAWQKLNVASFSPPVLPRRSPNAWVSPIKMVQARVTS